MSSGHLWVGLVSPFPIHSRVLTHLLLCRQPQRLWVHGHSSSYHIQRLVGKTSMISLFSWWSVYLKDSCNPASHLQLNILLTLILCSLTSCEILCLNHWPLHQEPFLVRLRAALISKQGIINLDSSLIRCPLSWIVEYAQPGNLWALRH